MENGSTSMGSKEISIAELMESPIRRKMYPISQEEGSFATITLSAKIAFAWRYNIEDISDNLCLLLMKNAEHINAQNENCMM